MRNPMWQQTTTLLACAVMLVAADALACSVCGCGDPLVSAENSAPSTGSVRAEFDWDYLTASAASDENPAATESLTQMSFRPVVVYSPNNRLNLVLQVPLVRKDWTVAGGDAPEAAKPFGLGDLDLGARFFIAQTTNLAAQRRQEFAVSIGTSLPTGANDAEVNGERIDDHAQLGTGSWGPYAGLLYALHRDPWNLTASLSGRLHSTNSFGYHYGSAMLWSVTGSYRAWDAVAFELGVDGRYAVRDTADGEFQVNTGGLLLALSPGVRVNPAGALWLNARAQVPFAHHLYGEQTVGPTFSVGAQYAF